MVSVGRLLSRFTTAPLVDDEGEPLREPGLALRHPTKETIADYATANLAPGASLVVAAHLELCPTCALVLKTIDDAPLWSGVRVKVMSPPVAHLASADPETMALPAVLQGVAHGGWSGWSPLGWRLAPLEGVSGLGEMVYLLKANPSASLPLGDGSPIELALVLQGAADAGAERLPRGAYADLSRTPLERPAADMRLGCVALVVSSAPLCSGPAAWLKSLIGRPTARRTPAPAHSPVESEKGRSAAES